MKNNCFTRKSNKLSSLKKKNEPIRVRQVIPGSWLANYGDYEYDEERERIYKQTDLWYSRLKLDAKIERTEPWMLDEVEMHFARLTCQSLDNSQNELLMNLNFAESSELRGKC